MVQHLLHLFVSRVNSELKLHILNLKYILNCLGLVHEDCITKMRLMSLVDLGSSDSGQIPYALIRDTLQVDLLFHNVCSSFPLEQLVIFFVSLAD